MNEHPLPSRCTVVAILIGSSLLAGCGDDDVRAPTLEAAAPAPIAQLPAGWTQLEPGGETTCARGDPFSYFVRPGSENKLIIERRLRGRRVWRADAARRGVTPRRVTNAVGRTCTHLVAAAA